MTSREDYVSSLSVEAYPGFKGEPTPRAFTHDGARREVSQILQRWYRNEMTYFRVGTSDGSRYVLRYDEDGSRWELVMLEEA
jgi:hypothetical protein